MQNLNLRFLVRRYLSAMWRYRWPAVLFAWFICAVGWALVFSLPNIYEANARLYVDADAVLTPLLRGIAVDADPSAQLEVLQRTLLSRPNLDTIISKTDLDLQVHNAAEREELVNTLGRTIWIVPQSRNLFSIIYRNPSPKLAVQVVQTVMNTFIESKAGSSREDMAAAGKFLDAQIANYEQQLQAVERRRADFRSKYVDLLPGADGGSSRLEDARTQVSQLEGQLQDATAKQDMINKELVTTPPLLTVEEAAGTAGGNAMLAQAEQHLAELKLQYTDQSPDVIAQQRLVNALRAGKIPSGLPAPPTAPHPVAGAGARSTPNPVYEQLKVGQVNNDAWIASLTRQVAEARAERDRLEMMAHNAPGIEADFTNLNRDYDVIRRNYEELLSRRESMRIGRAADTDAEKIKTEIVDPPQVPRTPVAPKRIMLTLGVLVAAIGGGAGLALVLLTFDQCFHTLDDLRAMGLPVVGGVTLLAATRTAARRLFTVTSFAAAASVPALVCVALVYRLLTHPNFPA
jgi:polysaccharide chain length determinant protein (PEP-CTERM system associated)